MHGDTQKVLMGSVLLGQGLVALLYSTLHSLNSADEPCSVVTLATVGMESCGLAAESIK